MDQGIVENSSDFRGNLRNLDNGVALETVVVLNSEENVAAGAESGVLNANIDRLESSERVMNPGTGDGQGTGESSKEGMVGNSINNSVTVMNSGETSSVSRETTGLGAKVEDLGLRGGIMNQETGGGYGDGEKLDGVEQGSGGCWSNSVNGVVLETVIVIDSEENVGISGGNGGLDVKGKELKSIKGTMDESNTKVQKVEKQSSVIDKKCVGGAGGGFEDSCDGERVCRICHLSSEVLLETTPSTDIGSTTSMNLIHLGCGCKDELGIAHVSCAEAWFKLKGNRICEICGETATNVTGVEDYGFLERRFISNNGFSRERSGGCWRGQPFCNFLMACLVIAFVLPWFFRVNLF